MHKDQTGTSVGATDMDVDQNPQGRGNPPGTPFNEGYTPSAIRGQTTAEATGSVHTENFFTPLYNESQTTDHSNFNINHQAPRHENTRDIEMAAAAKTTTVEGEASATSSVAEMEEAAAMDAEAVKAAELQTTNDTEAEAAAANAAEFVARLTAEAKAVATDEATTIKAALEATATAAAATIARLAEESATVVEATTAE